MLSKGVCIIAGTATLVGWLVATVFAGGGTIEVSTEEFQKISERLQHLEEQLQAKEVRIQKLEAQLMAREAAPQEVTKIAEQQESRLGALEAALAAPFGGEFALMPGGQSGPFGTGDDFFIAGAIDVPLLRRDPLLGQKLLGEVLIGYGRSTDEGVFTSPLSLFVPSLGLPPGSRLVSKKLEVKFLQFFVGTKYKLVDYGIKQLQKIVQPYVVTGLGFNVPLSRTSRAGVDINGDGKPV